MKLGAVKVALFYNTVLDDLLDDINNFLRGEAVTGPPAYAEGFVREQELVSIDFRADGATYTAMIVYTE